MKILEFWEKTPAHPLSRQDLLDLISQRMVIEYKDSGLAESLKELLQRVSDSPSHPCSGGSLQVKGPLEKELRTLEKDFLEFSRDCLSSLRPLAAGSSSRFHIWELPC